MRKSFQSDVFPQSGRGPVGRAKKNPGGTLRGVFRAGVRGDTPQGAGSSVLAQGEGRRGEGKKKGHWGALLRAALGTAERIGGRIRGAASAS